MQRPGVLLWGVGRITSSGEVRPFEKGALAESAFGRAAPPGKKNGPSELRLRRTHCRAEDRRLKKALFHMSKIRGPTVFAGAVTGAESRIALETAV